MAISAAVAVGPIADDLVAKIAERTATIKTGDGTKDSDMGPLVTKAHRDKVASYIDAGEADGAKVVVDGRAVLDGAGHRDPAGFWLGLTLPDNVTPEMSVNTDEIFGPVLSIVRVETYDEALELINSNLYGNGTAIFTDDGGAARRFQNEVEVGTVGINVPIPVPMAYFSFGGWKASLFGDSHAHGTEGVHFFTRTKAITTRWLDPSHGGINLGFPQNGVIPDCCVAHPDNPSPDRPCNWRRNGNRPPAAASVSERLDHDFDRRVHPVAQRIDRGGGPRRGGAYLRTRPCARVPLLVRAGRDHPNDDHRIAGIVCLGRRR